MDPKYKFKMIRTIFSIEFAFCYIIFLLTGYVSFSDPHGPVP